MRVSAQWILVLFCVSVGPFSAFAESFQSLVSHFSKPLLIENNDDALTLRLALLDSAGKGTKIRIATYTFDYGRSTIALAAHICKAAKNGAQIELIADAKSGGLAGRNDAFDGVTAHKQTEEIYQYLANCGAIVVIHNDSTSFVNFNGTRLPNIFGFPDGSFVLMPEVYLRVKQLQYEFVQALQPTLTRLGIHSDISGLVDNLRQLAQNIYELSGDASGGEDWTNDNYISYIKTLYDSILKDPVWGEVTPAKMQVITKAIETAIEATPDLRGVANQLRTFNRLTHRKLFLVEEGGQSCAIIGGRNLGDDYLTNLKGSYRDGDIFLCTQQNPSYRSFMTAANVDLNELITDRRDPEMGRGGAPVFIASIPKRAYQYQYIATGELGHADPVEATHVNGIELSNFTQPRMLLATWNPAQDEVRRELLKSIAQEQKEIYIETAYAEFDQPLRAALEAALSRGVSVHVVTNGMFISDGASGVIRPLMMDWNGRMAALYKDRFSIQFETLASGHMIHFKGAGFRCQKEAAGTGAQYFRSYIVGSDNFHPRSGYSDKENSLEWRETTDSQCADPSNDLIADREAYYAAEKGSLKTYKDLFFELFDVLTHPADPASLTMARMVRDTMYRENTKQYWLEDGPQYRHVRYIIDKGGLQDLLGRLL